MNIKANIKAATGKTNTAGSTPVERMYFAWNDALARNDMDALLGLYAEDAVLESPLVPYLLGIERRVCTDTMSCVRCSTKSPSANPRCASTTGPAI